VRLGLESLLEQFGDLAPSALTPVLFAAVRTKLLQSGKLNVRSLNTKLSYIRRMIDWGASMELVPITVRDACSTMKNVHQDEEGARPAREGEAVPENVVRATLPYLSRQAAALVELLLLTGARPSELVGVRPCDIDQSEEPWALRLQHHKTARKGKRREVYFGPDARAVLNRFLRRVPAPPADRPLFSPAAAETERRLEVARGRRTPRWASHMRRNAAKRVAAPTIAPGDAYTTGSLNRAIQRAVARANRDRAAEGKPQLPRWHVYQLRHTSASNLAKLFGIEAVRTVLGHSSVTMTEVYVERDLEQSRKIAESAG
jgi:integrase